MAQKMNMASVKAIMNKRILVPASAEGKKVSFVIQGNGNDIDVKNKLGEFVQSVVEEGVVLQKRIFNLRANSQIAMRNPANMQLLKEGMIAEKAGNFDLAGEKFNAYLNAVQISFGVLHPSALLNVLGNGCDIAAKVQKVTTDNGSLLTIDPSTISVLAPIDLGTTNFSFDEIELEETLAAPTATGKAKKPVEA